MSNIPLLRQGPPLRPKLEEVSSTFCEIETSSGVAFRNIILYSTKCTNHEDWYSIPLRLAFIVPRIEMTYLLSIRHHNSYHPLVVIRK